MSEAVGLEDERRLLSWPMAWGTHSLYIEAWECCRECLCHETENRLTQTGGESLGHRWDHLLRDTSNRSSLLQLHLQCLTDCSGLCPVFLCGHGLSEVWRMSLPFSLQPLHQEEGLQVREDHGVGVKTLGPEAGKNGDPSQGVRVYTHIYVSIQACVPERGGMVKSLPTY